MWGQPARWSSLVLLSGPTTGNTSEAWKRHEAAERRESELYTSPPPKPPPVVIRLLVCSCEAIGRMGWIMNGGVNRKRKALERSSPSVCAYVACVPQVLCRQKHAVADGYYTNNNTTTNNNKSLCHWKKRTCMCLEFRLQSTMEFKYDDDWRNIPFRYETDVHTEVESGTKCTLYCIFVISEVIRKIKKIEFAK